MVLGLRTKNRKGTSVQVDYLIHVQEIKPWPPSQSLRSLRSVLLQWENGDRSSGSTSPVVPSIGSGVGDGKIEFNESFRLPVTLSRDAPIKGGDAETFQKNCLEFNLYEPRRDKTVRGQLLGTVIIDLAEYGIIKETVNVGSPMNCKRSFRNTAQPVLFVKIQPFDKDSSTSLPRESLSKEASLDKDGRESVSALMSEEYAEEAEIASFTDDDVSSHSSLTHSSAAFEAAGVSPPQNEENVSETAKNSTVSCKEVPGVPLEQVPTKSEEKPTTLVYKLLSASSSHSSSINKPSDLGSPETDHVSSSNFPDKSLMLIPEKSVVHGVQSSSSSIAFEGSEVVVRSSNGTRSFDQDDLAQEVHENAGNGCSQSEEEPQLVQEINTNDFAAKASYSDTDLQVGEQEGLVTSADSHLNGKDNGKTWGQSRNGLEEAATTNDPHPSLMEDKDGDKQGENGQEELTGNEKNYSMEDKAFKKFSQVAVEKQVVSGGDTTSLNRRAFGGKGNTLVGDRLKHVKSVRSSLEVARSNGLVSDNKLTEEVKEIDFLEDADNVTKSVVTDGGKDPKVAFRETRKSLSDGKVQQLESRIERLEGELREAAAIEVALYSVMAEHGSSANKVHAPARRLSRLYLHACRKWSPARRASAARSAVSGLVLVAKACGNDIPRLTFWLSNSVVLRVVIGQAIEDSQLPISAGPRIETNGGGKGINRRSSLKWNESSPNKKEKKFGFAESFDEWEDPRTFTTALVKIEAWIFSRIIESVWWQILTPHMQSAAGKVSDQNLGSNPRKIFGRRSSLADQEQGNFSLDHWKKAFKGACERLCPVRAGGHECGCLPVLARLVMEQCVDRLDVAMFNAILRESDDEIPTDPVSDPISDAKVLPILAGKSSFGAGAQLKNAIGNWSRWLTDLFGIDDDSLEDDNELDDDDRLEFETSFKSFYLLNALSDLMMLPKDMLLNRSIRKEVCPTFGAPLIKRILNNFVPDEFCPDPIPEALLVALDSEEPLEAEEESIRNFPCSAARIVYLPPSTASLADSIGEVGNQYQLRRSGSSVLRKSYTSDDELDELDSPLASIIDSSRASPTSTIPSWKPERKGGRSAVRYQLLREVWRDDN